MRKLYIVISLLLLQLAPPLAWIRACVAQQSATADSKQQRSLSLQGLRERVLIRRDERGIPYIEAGNDADLYFAQGYAVASDRLWQMDLMRRTGRGELAEI